jgi:hypothetical protein
MSVPVNAPSLVAYIARLLFTDNLCRAALQVLFLNELEEVLELCRGEQLVQVQDNLFRLLAACLGSSHFQVRPKH